MDRTVVFIVMLICMAYAIYENGQSVTGIVSVFATIWFALVFFHSDFENKQDQDDIEKQAEKMDWGHR